MAAQGKAYSSSGVNRAQITIAYVVFLTMALAVYHLVANGEFTAVLTLSAVFQSLAFSLLGLQVFAGENLKGVSTTSLQLDALAIASRLSSTLFFEGYLPADVTGDFLYQAFDLLSLAMVVGLIYRAVNTQVCGGDAGSFPTKPLVASALTLAILFHGNLDDHALFDIAWMFGTLLGGVSVLPQLWQMTRHQGCVPVLTSHFMAAMAFGRILSTVYMWHAFEDMECDPWIGNFQHTGYFVLGAHVIHLLLLGDFAYFYCKHVATSGLQTPLELPLFV